MVAMNPNIAVQLISSTIACVGFAIIFKIRGRQVVYSGIGAFCTWAVYLLVYECYEPDNFLATLVASIFVAAYAEIMARVNKAPATIFLTASVFPLIPGANLYYMMYGLMMENTKMASYNAIQLVLTCLGIALGFIVVEILNKYLGMFYEQLRHAHSMRK